MRVRERSSDHLSAKGVSLVLALWGLCWMAEAAVTLDPPVKLDWHHYEYNTTCRYAEVFVRHQVETYYNRSKSLAPQLARLLYSDCLVTGCDGSILLDGDDSEKMAPQNAGLGEYAMMVIDKIKTVLEDRCPGIVSCADILNLATRDAVHLAGAPAYPVFTGRKDGMSSHASSVDLPSPSITWEEAKAYFKSRDLDEIDLATLLGAHSMGRTHCSYIMDRLYNFRNTGKPDPTMDSSLLQQLRKQCPPNSVKNATVFLDPESGPGSRFSASYFTRLLANQAVFEVDQQLLYNNVTVQVAREYAGKGGFEYFRQEFALSMSRMGETGVLTGDQGEIRRHCRFTNKDNPYIKP